MGRPTARRRSRESSRSCRGLGDASRLQHRNHVLRADRIKNGSWICMTKDSEGPPAAGRPARPADHARDAQRRQARQRRNSSHSRQRNDGHVVRSATCSISTAAGRDGRFGLYRCRDTKGDDSYDDVELLREWHGGAGEHGAHGIVLGPGRKCSISSAETSPILPDRSGCRARPIAIMPTTSS